MKARRNKMLLTTLSIFVVFFCLVSIIAVLGNRADAFSLLRDGIKPVKAEGIGIGIGMIAAATRRRVS